MGNEPSAVQGFLLYLGLRFSPLSPFVSGYLCCFGDEACFLEHSVENVLSQFCFNGFVIEGEAVVFGAEAVFGYPESDLVEGIVWQVDDTEFGVAGVSFFVVVGSGSVSLNKSIDDDELPFKDDLPYFDCPGFAYSESGGECEQEEQVELPGWEVFWGHDFLYFQLGEGVCFVRRAGEFAHWRFWGHASVPWSFFVDFSECFEESVFPSV